MKKLAIKLTAILTMAALLPMLWSCSADRSADVRDILKTIPSDASAVVVADMEGILKSLGCKVKDGHVTPGKDILSRVSVSEHSPLNTLTSIYLDPDSGVDPSVGAFFGDGSNIYFSGFLNDTEKFRNIVEKRMVEKFRKDGELEVCSNIAMTANRFWICLSSLNTIYGDNIRHYIELSDTQSILSNKEVEALADGSDQLRGWADLKGLMATMNVGFKDRAVYSMALEATYADATHLTCKANLKKESLDAEVSVLNSKGGIAKFLYPVSKIDENALKNLNGTGDKIVAMAISPKMVDKLKEETGNKGISVLGIFANMLGCVDGTCAVAISDSGRADGFFTTKGTGTSELTDMLSQYGMQVKKADKLLYFSGDLEEGAKAGGKLTGESVAKAFGGAMAGIATDMSNDKKKPFEQVTLLFKPDKGGMKIEMRCKLKQ